VRNPCAVPRCPGVPSFLLLICILALAGCKQKQTTPASGGGASPGSGSGKASPTATGARAGTLSAVLALSGKQRPGVGIRTAGGQWTTLAVGQAVTEGSSLRTTRGARARLVLRGGVILHINEDTLLELRSAAAVKISRGSLLIEREPDGEGEALVLSTPRGSVEVSGTKLHLAVEDGQDLVDVTRGTVQVKAGGAAVELGAGERAVLRPGKSPRVDAARDLAAVTRWAREITPPAEQAAARPGFGSLTARAPGQGKSHALTLAEHKVRVVVRDNVARTEIEQRYHNAGGSTLEGTYRFPLPAGANISRLALYVGSRLEEGEIVERRRAKRIFKQIVDDSIRPRDPALLEWVGGRMFQMKIFPIPPRSSRRVILAYTQVLEASYGRYRYEYPMTAEAGRSTEVGKFSVDMKLHSSLGLGKINAPLYPVTREQSGDAVRLRYEASAFRPTAGFVVEMAPERSPPELQLALHEKRPGAAGARCALRGTRGALTSLIGNASPCGDRGGFFMAVLRPELPAVGRSKPRDHLFLLDSSYNTTARNWKVQLAALEAFLAEMDLRSKFNIMACDSKCRTWSRTARAPRAAARKEALTFVQGITPGGASDIQGAFEQAAQLASAMGRGVKVVYMGDGKATAGELREPQLARLVVGALQRAGAVLDMLQVGEDAAAMFMAMATRRLSGAVHVLGPGDDLGARVFDMVAAQYRPTLTDLEVTFEGGVDVHHVYPGRLPSLSAGSEVMLVGRYGKGGQGAIRVRGKVGARPFERRYPVSLAAQTSEARANNFIPRVWARHHLEALSAADATGNRPEIVRVSQAYTVMSRPTAFLVLENERMYREFNVKRKRNREYWKGDEVATRAAKDSPETEKNADGRRSAAEKAGGTMSAGGKALGGAASGPAKAGSTAAAPRPSADPRPLAAAANKRAASRSRRQVGEGALDDLAFDSSGDGGEALGARAPDRDEEAAPPPAEPAATATPRPRPKAKKKPAPAGRFAQPPPASRPATGMAMPTKPRRSRRPYGYYYRWKRVRSGVISPMLSFAPSSGTRRSVERYSALVKAQPLRRSHRRALHRHLVLGGDYARALEHATGWTGLDSDSSQALRALGDVQAASGETTLAARSYGSGVEVNPYSTRLQRRMADMYRNQGDTRRSCAHLWSLVSIRPHQLSYNLDLVRCLAPLPGGKELALQILSELSANPKARRHSAAIGRALAALQRATLKATTRRPATSGALVVRATWDKPVDLDIAVVTPRGERLSALQGVRGGKVEANSKDGRTVEVLRFASARSGTYRVEVTRPAFGQESGPISGTVIVRAHGKSRTIPFVISTASTKPLARVKLTERRVRVRYR